MKTASVIAALAVVGARAQAATVDKLQAKFGPCPREVVPFLKYIVQRRGAEGVNRATPGAPSPAKVLVYHGGGAENANVAWVAAAAYKWRWSRYHKDPILKQRALAILDAMVQLRPKGNWDDGGLDAYFVLQSFAWAALEWIETGDVDSERADRYREHVRRAAEHAMVCMFYGPYRPSHLTGQYANPEMYYLSGLAAAWKLTGERKFYEEAARALRRYDDWLFPGGGVAYFLKSSPQHGYQNMVVKSVALYWLLTEDPYATEFLRRLAPYYPNVQHRSGLMTDAENPHLKHTWSTAPNPATLVLLACATGDGANSWAAEAATKVTAERADERKPSFGKGIDWYNYHASTYAAAALRMMASHRLPKPEPLPARRVFVDGSFRGVRSHWDDFTSAVGTRQMNDSLAGAYLADPSEPNKPLAATVDGVRFEVLEHARAGRRGSPRTFRCVQWDPTVYFTHTDDFASVSCLTRLCLPYWGNLPPLAGDGRASDVSDWTCLQHWAVWRDALIGLADMRCHADGGDGGRRDVARVVWRLGPHNRELQVEAESDDRLKFRYGGLSVELVLLAEQGGFRFRWSKLAEEPYRPEAAVLERVAPWKTADFVQVATIVRPADAEGEVLVKSLKKRAAAVCVEPDRKKMIVWLANLGRYQQQTLLDLPTGVRCRGMTRDVRLPPVPRGEPANLGLLGGQNAIWMLEANAPMDPKAVLSGLRAGKH